MRGTKRAWVQPDSLVVTTKPQDGTWLKFDSTREARRYVELRGRELTGDVSSLRRQVRIPLHAAHIALSFQVSLPDDRRGLWKMGIGDSSSDVVGHYVADFVYLEPEPGVRPVKWRLVVEDAKGWKTDTYKWKKRHVKAQYGIEIRES